MTGPTDIELERIEAAWPVTAAELAVVDAECQVAADPDNLTARLALTAAHFALGRARAAYQPLQIGA